MYQIYHIHMHIAQSHWITQVWHLVSHVKPTLKSNLLYTVQTCHYSPLLAAASTVDMLASVQDQSAFCHWSSSYTDARTRIKKKQTVAAVLHHVTQYQTHKHCSIKMIPVLNRVTTLQTIWNFLSFPWLFAALLHGTRHVKCYSYHAQCPIRRYIPNCAEIVAPITELTKNKMSNVVKWGNRQEEAFTKIKECLSSEPILKLPWVHSADRRVKSEFGRLSVTNARRGEAPSILCE